MTTPETREQQLERLLVELVDAVVGASYHDLHGYGYSPDEIKEIESICRPHWAAQFDPQRGE